jgi:Mn2+/Fe2+ NRAMP family transporter
MGALVNRRVTNIAAVAVTAVIVALNVYLLATA